MPKPTPPAISTKKEPVFTGSSSNQHVDPAYWPCQQGQIKGNNNSGKYHVPGGRYYAKTFKNVTCFNTEQAAQQAGFVAAKNQ